jgi:hydroxyacylglutathione hydrolase
LGGVNCYLVKTDTGFILIDTGFSSKRGGLEMELESAGCKPGNLVLILITHADSDHSGNAAFLREKYGAKIAIHRGESEVVERGDMLLSRKKRPFLTRIVLPFFRLGESDRFKPDFTIEDRYDLSEYGFDAQVLHIPGHSIGSVGILTADGDPSVGSGQALFCGELLTNTGKPALNSLMDDPAAANASFERLKRLEIQTVYPGHGKPFTMELFLKNHH